MLGLTHLFDIYGILTTFICKILYLFSIFILVRRRKRKTFCFIYLEIINNNFKKVDK